MAFTRKTAQSTLYSTDVNAIYDGIETAQGDINLHKSDIANPHTVTKAQVGLGNADNTSDAAKPVSTATQTALDGKAAKSHQHGLEGLTATGIKDTTTFLRGDNTFGVPPDTTYAIPTQLEAEAGTAITARVFTAERVKQAILALAPVKADHTHTSFGALTTGNITGSAGAVLTFPWIDSGSGLKVAGYDTAPTINDSWRQWMFVLRSGLGVEDIFNVVLKGTDDIISTKRIVTETFADNKYLRGDLWLTATATRIQLPTILAGVNRYPSLPTPGSGGDFGTANNAARGDHIHDGRYYTETETNNLLNGKLGPNTTLNNMWTTANKTIAAGGPWSFRSAPVVSVDTLIGSASSGWGVFDSGNRIAANGNTWAYIYIANWSWGFIVQEGIV